jgi:DNA-directed RNA polymerase specialized sigma24 family protein
VKEKLSRKVPEEKAATAEQVEAALEDLYKKPAELLKLRDFARFRIRGLGRAAMGRNEQDLLQEAVTSTLAGARRWNKTAVDLTGHLLGAMKSISSHWGEKFKPEEPYLRSEITIVPSVEEAEDPIEAHPSQGPNPEQILTAKQQFEELERIFADDYLVLLIMDARREGMTGPETQQALGISQTEYETAMKRLRLKVRTFLARG